jgi:deazaflavin-dependent oxidoreductase (nitroreductase family)
MGDLAEEAVSVPIPETVARFNRRVTNPIARLAAGRAPGFAMVEHTGRKTGKTYRTPVSAFGRGDRLAIALTYGSGTDWVKNVVAAGGATIERFGKRRGYTDLRIVRDGEGAARMPSFVRLVLRRLNVHEFLLLRAAPAGQDRGARAR